MAELDYFDIFWNVDQANAEGIIVGYLIATFKINNNKWLFYLL